MQSTTITYKSFIDIATTEGVSFIHALDSYNPLLQNKTDEEQMQAIEKSLDFCNIDTEKIICIKNSQGFKRGTSYFVHTSGNKYFKYLNYFVVFTK